MSSGARVSIPNGARKTIQNIKEITGNHSDEEIYAMLRECSMDPNETVQKLIFQDPFHEVKRKRDRRKENLSNKEPAESRWRPGMQGRGSRGGRENYSIRNSSSDFLDLSSSQSSAPFGKGINQVADKGVGLSMPIEEMKIKENGPAKSPLAAGTNGPVDVARSTDVQHSANTSSVSFVKQPEVNKAVDKWKLGGPKFPQVNAKETRTVDEGDSHGKLSSKANGLNVGTETPSPGGYFSASDPDLVPYHNSRLPGAEGTFKHEAGSKQSPTAHVLVDSSEGKTSADPEAGSSSAHEEMLRRSDEEMLRRSDGVGSDEPLDSSESLSSTHCITWPSSNSSNQPHQEAGLQKVAISKESKPESEDMNLARGSLIAGSSEIATAVETKSSSDPLLHLDSEDAAITSQRKIEKLPSPYDQHVLIPNHFHVPETEKIGFCFGSFDVAFDLSTMSINGPENDRSQIPLSEIVGDAEETAEQFESNNMESTATNEGDHPEDPHSPRNVTEVGPLVENVAPLAAVPDYSEPKETTLPPATASNQHSTFQIGFIPQVGSHLAPFDASEAQVRDVSCFPSFAAGNTLVLTTPIPTPLGSQATVILPSSMAVTQQPPSVLRQPTAVPLPHYAPQYIPYGHYFSPFYAPTSAIHQYLSNGAFSQQHQPGAVYPLPPGPAAKYSLPQFKVGSHPAAGNLNASEDLTTSQFKETSIYIAGQQNEGLPIWIPAAVGDVSGLGGSFYNIPCPTHVTFAPTQQTGHGTFTGIYHHHPGQAAAAANVYSPHLQPQPQTLAVDMVRPATIVYQQQPPNAQIYFAQ